MKHLCSWAALPARADVRGTLRKVRLGARSIQIEAALFLQPCRHRHASRQAAAQRAHRRGALAARGTGDDVASCRHSKAQGARRPRHHEDRHCRARSHAACRRPLQAPRRCQAASRLHRAVFIPQLETAGRPRRSDKQLASLSHRSSSLTPPTAQPSPATSLNRI